jgi:hypothetical protein
VTLTQAGGDSLTAMQLHNLIKSRFGVHIPLEILLARDREAIVTEIEKLKRMRRWERRVYLWSVDCYFIKVIVIFLVDGHFFGFLTL